MQVNLALEDIAERIPTPCAHPIYPPPSKFVAILFCVACLWLVPRARAQQSQSMPRNDAEARVAWRRSMKKTPLPKHGCYTAAYPKNQWQEGACATAPKIPFVPKKGQSPQTVGNGNDYVAEVTSGLLSEADGAFPDSSGVTSESGYVNGTPPAYSNSFSLQLNSNYFGSAPACGGAYNPSLCAGWQQFIFAQGYGEQTMVYMQYWLLNYDTVCPSGWTYYFGDCYQNSSAIVVPTQQITNISNLVLSGEAANGTDTVMFDASGDVLSAVGQDSVLDLEQHWTEAEFNVFGNGDGGEANFNNGSSLVVLTDVTNGTTYAPQCIGPQGAGTTGETNNLNIVPVSGALCCPYGGSTPAILFMESNSQSAPASAACEAIPSTINGSRTLITYPIIQGETRVLYSAKLEDSTPGASITYTLFDACGNSVESATVSSGTTISYLDTEIDGESCTYGIRGTIYASQPEYFQSPPTEIIF